MLVILGDDHRPGKDGAPFDKNLAALLRLAAAHAAPLITIQNSSDRHAAMTSNGVEKVLRTLAVTDATLNQAVADAVRIQGKSNLVLAGRPSEGLVTFTALGALTQGLDVVIVEDCCQSDSAHVHRIAMHRLRQAGAIITTAVQLRAEWIATQSMASQQKVAHPF